MPVLSPDSFLTVEFAEMERYSIVAAQQNTPSDFWCLLETDPRYVCLDVGAPSTLANTLNVTSTMTLPTSAGIVPLNFTQTNQFGQFDLCDGKTVSDGVINVFDIAVIIAYSFQDEPYRHLPTNPALVETTSGRHGLSDLCYSGLTRLDYLTNYSFDTCVYMEEAELDGRRRLSESTNATTLETWESGCRPNRGPCPPTTTWNCGLGIRGPDTSHALVTPWGPTWGSELRPIRSTSGRRRLEHAFYTVHYLWERGTF